MKSNNRGGQRRGGSAAMSSIDNAKSIQNLSKCYQSYGTLRDRLEQFVAPPLQRLIGQQAGRYFREFWALRDVSFNVKKMKWWASSGATDPG
jgi:hypothetical protein